MPKTRPKQIRQLPRRMHIYCEGAKTEPNYIQRYIDCLADKALREVVKIEPCKKNTPTQLVDIAVEHKKSRDCPDGDIFWVVYDRESPAQYSDKLHDQAYEKARHHGVSIALSNVCFEQWLLLHFINSDASYTCFNDLLARSNFKSEYKKASGRDYDKGAIENFEFSQNQIAQARTRAKSINERTLRAAPNGKTKPHNLNPYSDIPKLLDAIDSFRG